MIKKYRTIKEVGRVIKDASQELSIKEVINPVLQSKGDVQGNEEKITDVLENRINLALIKEIEKKLNTTKFKGLKINIHTYSKYTEEPKIGADFAGVLEIDLGKGATLRKIFLAQAKVCKITGKHSRTRTFSMSTNDAKVPKQATDMLNITSDSFFFLYTNKGIYVIPALEVELYNKVPRKPRLTIDTTDIYYKSIGSFYEDFFKCFIGDHKIAHTYKTTEELLKIVNTVSVFHISVDNNKNTKDS